MTARKSFISELVADGYELEDLKILPTEDLAVLVQDSFVENAWSEAARAAALATRRSHHAGILKQHGFKASHQKPNRDGSVSVMYHKETKTGVHMVQLDRSKNGTMSWSHDYHSDAKPRRTKQGILPNMHKEGANAAGLKAHLKKHGNK